MTERSTFSKTCSVRYQFPDVSMGGGALLVERHFRRLTHSLVLFLHSAPNFFFFFNLLFCATCSWEENTVGSMRQVYSSGYPCEFNCRHSYFWKYISMCSYTHTHTHTFNQLVGWFASYLVNTVGGNVPNSSQCFIFGRGGSVEGNSRGFTFKDILSLTLEIFTVGMFNFYSQKYTNICICVCIYIYIHTHIIIFNR